MTYDIEARRRGKMRSDDRILILKVMEGKTAKDYAGKVDPRLFSGENKLHGIYDPQSGMWNMRYQTGSLPEPLRQKFMTFEELEMAARKYFATRNVEISGVID